MLKKTGWFSSDTPPTRRGVYERLYEWGVEFAYFDGKDWGLASETVDDAVKWKGFKTLAVCDWRGLTGKAVLADAAKSRAMYQSA
jgi:hypothetical protein